MYLRTYNNKMSFMSQWCGMTSGHGITNCAQREFSG